MKNILILEDDELQSGSLKELILRNAPNCNVVVCATEQEAREKVNTYEFHILFIDLILQEGSGMAFAKWIRTIPRYQMVWIVIVTGHDCFSLEAIRQTHCFDYIVKPYQEADILSVLGRIIKSRIVKESETNYLTVLSKGISFRIKLNEISYIEINNKNMDIHTGSKVYTVKRYPLSKIKNQLPKDMFMQCHRSFIVNVERINAVESRSRDTFIVLDNHEKSIPVGIRYKSMFSAESLMDFM